MSQKVIIEYIFKSNVIYTKYCVLTVIYIFLRIPISGTVKPLIRRQFSNKIWSSHSILYWEVAILRRF